MKLTIQDLKKAVYILNKNECKPRVVKSKKEAKAMNEHDKSLGLISNWKVGDEYWVMTSSNVNYPVKDGKNRKA